MDWVGSVSIRRRRRSTVLNGSEPPVTGTSRVPDGADNRVASFGLVSVTTGGTVSTTRAVAETEATFGTGIARSVAVTPMVTSRPSGMVANPVEKVVHSGSVAVPLSVTVRP